MAKTGKYFYIEIVNWKNFQMTIFNNKYAARMYCISQRALDKYKSKKNMANVNLLYFKI